MSDLFIGNVPFKAEDADLRAVFEKYGAVREARIVFDRVSAHSRGFAFITFERVEDADAAFGWLTADLLARAMASGVVSVRCRAAAALDTTHSKPAWRSRWRSVVSAGWPASQATSRQATAFPTSQAWAPW